MQIEAVVNEVVDTGLVNAAGGEASYPNLAQWCREQGFPGITLEACECIEGMKTRDAWLESASNAVRIEYRTFIAGMQRLFFG